MKLFYVIIVIYKKIHIQIHFKKNVKKKKNSDVFSLRPCILMAIWQKLRMLFRGGRVL